MNLKCFILGHDEDVENQMIYCVRCKVWIVDGYAPNPDLQPSLELAARWRSLAWGLPYHGRLVEWCECGKIKRVFWHRFRGHMTCDIPF